MSETAPTPEPSRSPWLRRSLYTLAFTATLFVGVAIGMADDSAEREAGAASSELSTMQADLEEAQDERRELESQLEEVQAQRDTLKERLDEERAAAEQAQADPDESEPEPEPEAEPEPEPEPKSGPETTTAQEQAIGSAEDYLSFSAFSRSGLIDQLEFEGFSTSDATFAVDQLNVDWNEQAAQSARDYLEFSSFSRSGLIEQLEFEGFTREQAEYGATEAGL